MTLKDNFLPMPLIYGGETKHSFSRFKFPESFSLSVNPKQCSNTTESIKVVNKVLLGVSGIRRFFVTIYCSSNMNFFFWVAIKEIKNNKLVYLTPLNHGVKRYGRFHTLKFLYLDE